MKLSQILQEKGGEVYCIDASATLANVVAELVAKNCGSLMVTQAGRPVGIITERDILRTCAMDQRPLAEIAVSEKMSTNLITAIPEDDVATVMGLLTEKRIRHLPIVEGDRLAGMISIGDVVKAQHAALAQENHYLKSYIQS